MLLGVLLALPLLAQAEPWLRTEGSFSTDLLAVQAVIVKDEEPTTADCGTSGVDLRNS